MMSKICIPIQATTFQELKQKIKAAEKKIDKNDLVEIWIDHLRERTKIEPEKITKLTKKPLIIVNKVKKEQGKWHGSEKDRIKILKEFANAKVKYIDVGMDTKPALLSDLMKSKKTTKIILSYHNFKSTPSEKKLWEIVRKGFKKGADIVKIATFAQKKEDNIKILSVLTKARRQKLPIIAVCMGKKGVISRIMAPHFNSSLVYGALDKNSKTAPGQLTIDDYNKFATLFKKI